MAVEDVTKTGGRIPTNVTAPRAVRQTIADRYQEAVATAMETKAQMDVLGVIPHAVSDGSQSKVQEKFGLDLSSIVNGQTKLVSDLLGQITTLSARTQDAQSRAEITRLEAQLAEVMKALNTPAPNPLQVLAEGWQAVEMINDKIKAKNPAPAPVPTNEQTSVAVLQIQTNLQLQLTQMQLEAAERQRQHERDMAMERRRWIVEDRRWKQEQEFSLYKFQVENQTAAKRADQLGSILGAAFSGIDVTKLLKGGGNVTAGAQANQAPPKPQAPPQDMPGMVCPDCGQAIEATNEDIVQCTTCGTMLDLRTSEEKAMAAAQEQELAVS